MNKFFVDNLKMKISLEPDLITVGLDEVGRGCMMGRLYCGAVIFAPDESNLDDRLIKDSKKFSSRIKRAQARDYILDNCLDYGIAYCEPELIDTLGLSRSWIQTMHNAIRQLDVVPERILVDGNYFEQYETIPYSCIIGGDATYYPIAAASIIAKVAHDEYIIDLVDRNPILKEYGIDKNMGYGTKTHMDAITRLGLTQFHRKTFGGKSKDKSDFLAIPKQCLI